MCLRGFTLTIKKGLSTVHIEILKPETCAYEKLWLQWTIKTFDLASEMFLLPFHENGCYKKYKEPGEHHSYPHYNDKSGVQWTPLLLSQTDDCDTNSYLSFHHLYDIYIWT